jgi:hypothetical protein
MKIAVLPSIKFMLFLLLTTSFSYFQESGLESITERELREHLTYLASDEMEGRKTGEAGLDRAAEYLAAQSKKIGLKAIDNNGDYYQEYTLVNRAQDFSRSNIVVHNKNGSEVTSNKKFYFLNSGSDTIDISGDVVFAGYGIQSQEYGYDDLGDIDLEGKVVVIMNGGPRDEEGNSLLEKWKWQDSRSFTYKIPALSEYNPKAVLIVPSPESGYKSMDEMSRSITRYLSKSRFVQELDNAPSYSTSQASVPIIFVHSDVVDELLISSGKTLEKLQNKISRSRKPASFPLKKTGISIHAEYNSIRKSVPNIVGLVEGTDPELKKELLIYSAHFDHLGVAPNGEIYNGADDNASGVSALLELAEAFLKEKKNLKRSVLFLWVSGEEIGLYGSKFYSEYPLFPLNNTLADINLDMIGTVRTARDTGSIYRENVEVMGMDSIQLIGGHQSSDLLAVHTKVAGEMGFITDISKNSPDHPYRYYFRSDHFNFARNDIPVLFYSTGTHIDYHKTSDNITRINFTKLKKVTELSFRVGYELVTMPERIVVDNPYSQWEGSK